MTTNSQSHDATPAPVQGVGAYLAVAAVALLLLACPVAVGSGDWSPVLAWLLTFVPGALIVSQAARFHDPKQAIPYMLLSTMFRFAVAGGGGLLVIWLVPSVSRTAFLLWLGGMYLVALSAEIYLTMSINSLWKLVAPAPQTAAPANHFSEAGR